MRGVGYSDLMLCVYIQFQVFVLQIYYGDTVIIFYIYPKITSIVREIRHRSVGVIVHDIRFILCAWNYFILK
jgi:hypothetical protein